MCGINLVVDRTGKVSPDVLKGMIESTKHRGPDQIQYKIVKKNDLQIMIGVSRLRIVNQNENSDQPFFSSDENRFLLFNGEIYNHQDKKNQLIKLGFHFNTDSDTEVLFYFLQSNMSRQLDGINGMFSFVLIDLKDNSIFIARDRWGMKPLYYYLDDRYLIISSEVQGIIASGLVPKLLNTDQIPFYLRYRYSFPPYTLFRNIFQFLKGRLFAFDLNEFKLEETPMPENQTERPVSINRSELFDQLESLLIDSLILHTQARNPVGLFLSGGVDSTLILALSAKHGIPIPYIFSIFNKKRDKNVGTEDYKYVRSAVKQYHHTAEMVEVDETLMDELENIISKMDHPVADPAFVLTYKLAKIAKKKTSVVLSGAGGDELFAGYNRHIAFYKYLKNYKSIKKWMKVLKNINPLLQPDLNFFGRKRIRLLKKFMNKVKNDPWITYDNFLSFEKLNPPLFQDVWDYHPIDDHLDQYLSNALERDRQEYLPEDVLTVSDRASMLSSVEMRMPYLDRNLTAFVNRIPTSYLLKSGRKWILREILNRYDGEKYSKRPKEGFGFPFGQWIRQEKFHYLTNTITDKKNLLFEYVNRENIVKLVQEHMLSKEDNSQELWSILVLGLWIKKNFG